jgi:NADH:ubiquinone oxidoreductase subunit E
MKITIKDVEQIMKNWKNDPEYLIEMLQDVQESCRYLPEEALRHIAHTLDIPLKRLYHISTFFSSFSLEEKGKHIIQICMGTACHVKGAPAILDAFSRELNIESGGTTKDKEFTVEGVRCLGCCSLAPAVAINEKIYGGVTVSQVASIIKETRDGGRIDLKSTPKKGTGKCACKDTAKTKPVATTKTKAKPVAKAKAAKAKPQKKQTTQKKGGK